MPSGWPIRPPSTILQKRLRRKAVSDKTVPVTDADFDQKVLKAATPVLVDFWAAWCGPCRMVAPVLEELAEEYKDKMVVAKLNVDQNAKTTAKYHVMSIPTMLLFKNGQLVTSVVGYKPKAELKKNLDSALG
ncbi:MAG: thioredoxin [Chloroflexi bacterium]|nr:thioredoxin [Chloroflexota bacterium]